MDCGCPDTEWGGISFGILLCLHCGGRHRSLGSHISVVRSLSMDLWTRAQIQSLLLGGNRQLHGWFIKCGVHRSDIEMKYVSKAATMYRKTLAEAVKDTVAGGAEAGWENDVDQCDGEQPAPSTVGGNAIAVAARIAYKEDQESERQQRKKEEKMEAEREKLRAERTAVAHRKFTSARAFATELASGEYEIEFGQGSLGFSVTKNPASRSVVTRVVPDGQAGRSGARVGDVLVGIDGRHIYDYDDMMLVLSRASRPMRLIFHGVGLREPAADVLQSAEQAPKCSSLGSDVREVGDSNTNSSDNRSGSSSSSSSEDRGPILLRLSVGLGVLIDRGESRKKAFLTKQHKDGTWRVKYEDGTSEKRVESADMLPLKNGQGRRRCRRRGRKLENTACAAEMGAEEVQKDIAGQLDDTFFDSGGYDSDEMLQGITGGGGKQGKGLHNRNKHNAQQNQLHSVRFERGSLGLTIIKGGKGAAVVMQTEPGGQAEKLGIVPGLSISNINGHEVQTYEQVMQVISSAPRPVDISFCRTDRLGQLNPQQDKVGGAGVVAALSGIMEMANSIANGLGIGIDSMPQPPQSHRSLARPRAHENPELKAIPAAIVGGFGGGLRSQSRTLTPAELGELSMTTKQLLSDSPMDAKDFDVTFGEGELGFTLEEKGFGTGRGFSTVEKVASQGQARENNVSVGCVVVGLNGEKYLGHAHTIASLKHGRRPVTVRFRQP
jgi:hypothetical protein